MRDQASIPTARCQIGEAVFEPSHRLMARDEELDLAVLHSSAVLAASAHASLHCPPLWPPKPVEVGEAVIIGGYAGQLRSEDSEADRTHFPFVSFITTVSDASPERIVCSVQLATAFSTQGYSLRDDFHYGGASGGPVYRLSEGALLTTLELIGIIYEYAPGIDALKARPTSLILKSGAIERPMSNREHA